MPGTVNIEAVVSFLKSIYRAGEEYIQKFTPFILGDQNNKVIDIGVHYEIIKCSTKRQAKVLMGKVLTESEFIIRRAGSRHVQQLWVDVNGLKKLLGKKDKDGYKMYEDMEATVKIYTLTIQEYMLTDNVSSQLLTTMATTVDATHISNTHPNQITSIDHVGTPTGSTRSDEGNSDLSDFFASLVPSNNVYHLYVDPSMYKIVEEPAFCIDFESDTIVNDPISLDNILQAKKEKQSRLEIELKIAQENTKFAEARAKLAESRASLAEEINRKSILDIIQAQPGMITDLIKLLQLLP